MSNSYAPDSITVPAGNDVCEFALLAFEPQWLLWNKTWNVSLAQMAWNAGSSTEQPVRMWDAYPDPKMEEFLQHLLEVRRTRFKDREFCVADLDAHVVDGEIVFTFLLSWNGGEMTRPCKWTVANSFGRDAPLVALPPPRPPLVTDLGQAFSIMVPRP